MNENSITIFVHARQPDNGEIEVKVNDIPIIIQPPPGADPVGRVTRTIVEWLVRTIPTMFGPVVNPVPIPSEE